MAQFRVEFLLDPATGMYLAELYHPDNENEMLVRTEPLYPTHAAAVLGVVQIFKEAMLEFPFPAPEQPAKRKKKRKTKAGKAAKKKVAKKKTGKKKSRKKR